MDADQQRLAKLRVRQAAARRRIRVAVHDAEQLPWVDGRFDAVVSVNTFHHLQHPLRVLEEMRRVLKSGGKLVVSDLSPRGFQIFDRMHRSKGDTHPRLKKPLAEFARGLRRRGWKTKQVKGCNQEILVATAPPVLTEQEHA